MTRGFEGSVKSGLCWDGVRWERDRSKNKLRADRRYSIDSGMAQAN